jgi:hypothetical protein
MIFDLVCRRHRTTLQASVSDVIRHLLELIGTPLESELEPCTDTNDGSVFHYTWVGIPWFTCQ